MTDTPAVHRPHAEIDHTTPGRVMIRATQDGEHTHKGQMLPVNDVAKGGVLAARDGDVITWSFPAGAEFYVDEDAAAALVSDGVAERVDQATFDRHVNEDQAHRRRVTDAEERQKLAELKAKFGG